jgi:hypothetical protein
LYCKTGDDCLQNFELIQKYDGIPTGRCNQTSLNNQTTGLCEIIAWCPVESEDEK